MPNLKQLQSNFQNTILNAAIPEGRLRIYQNGYYERIITAMKQDFPVIHAFLGEKAFSGLICDYIDAYPSRHFNLRLIGENLSCFLKSKGEETILPFVDLAEFEWLMCQSEFNKAEINFKSSFNITEVWHAFHADNKLIEIIGV